MVPNSIPELVHATLADTNNTHWVFNFARLSKVQAIILQPFVQADLTGIDRLIDSSGIRHALGRHGNSAMETKHGQIAIYPEDFRLIPTVLQNPDTIEFIGQNALKQYVFLYSKRIGDLYFVAEAVRKGRKATKLVFQTMYKRK